MSQCVVVSHHLPMLLERRCWFGMGLVICTSSEARSRELLRLESLHFVAVTTLVAVSHLAAMIEAAEKMVRARVVVTAPVVLAWMVLLLLLRYYYLC